MAAISRAAPTVVAAVDVAAAAPALTSIFEHMRYYVIVGWAAPAPAADPPRFADASGAATVTVPTKASGWEVVINDRVDVDGWMYGSVFGSFTQRLTREGGRAAKRSTDFVRRREWRPTGSTEQSEDAKTEVVFTAEQDDKSLAISCFKRLLRENVLQRKVIDMPLDPTAWIRLNSAHKRADEPSNPAFTPLVDADTEVVARMARAMVYARAAYGYPMLNGNMDNVASAVSMQTVRKAHFDLTSEVDDESNTKALKAMATINDEDLPYVFWKAATFTPAHFIALDHTQNWVVLGIRGTLHPEDALTDACGTGAPFYDGFAHDGILKAAEKVIDTCAVKLLEVCRAHPTYQLIVTGHSLGAGTTALVTMLLRKGVKETSPVAAVVRDLPPAIGYAFAPPCLLTQPLAEECAPYVYSAVYHRDIVPRLSVTNLNKLMYELNDKGAMAAMVRLVGTQNAATNYQQNRSRVLEGVKDSDILFPPGNMYHIHRTEERAVLCHSRPDFYDRVLLATCMVSDHLPDRYMQAMQEAVAPPPVVVARVPTGVLGSITSAFK